MFNPIKVVIGIASTGEIRVETTKALCHMLSHGAMPLIYEIHTPISCYVHQNRERIANVALELESDYVLYLDTDMVFPPDALMRLINHNKDIIGVMYNYRELPKKSVIKLDKMYNDECNLQEDETGKVWGTLSDETKPFRCRAVGTGFLLVKTEVFRKLKKPWFFFQPEMDNPKQDFVGEDIWFCDWAREQGYEIWCDPTIEMGHIGAVVF